MKLKSALATGLLVLALSVAGTAPANAACSGSGTKTSTTTRAITTSCYTNQARIDRYVGGSVVIDFVYGPMKKDSLIKATHGTHAGNAMRGQETSKSAWTNWTMI